VEVIAVFGTVYGPDVVFLVIMLGALALAIYCIVDAARQPALSSGQKAAWIAGFVIGWLVFSLLGIILEVVYLAAVRPRLSRPPG
jgi:hypothetical protein